MILFFKILPLTLFLLLQSDPAGPDYSLLNHIDNKGNFMTVDELGSLYLVNEEQLTKFDIDGKLLFTYTNLYNGNITSVDVGDPFKILVYYRDFSQIVFLDNFLSKSAVPISLESIKLELATLACSSYNNGFWVYLPQSFELVRIAQDMIISNRSGDLSSIVQSEIDPNYIVEKDNFVYLNDPNIGIMIFDKYGTYYKTIPMMNLQYFQVEGNNIISSTNANLRIYDLKTLEESVSSLPVDDPICVSFKYSFKPKRLFLLNKNGINFYSVKLDQQ